LQAVIADALKLDGLLEGASPEERRKLVSRKSMPGKSRKGAKDVEKQLGEREAPAGTPGQGRDSGLFATRRRGTSRLSSGQSARPR
jgi:hypothetical protein